VDPVCFVIELQVAQHHDSTQHKSSRVRKVLASHKISGSSLSDMEDWIRYHSGVEGLVTLHFHIVVYNES